MIDIELLRDGEKGDVAGVVASQTRRGVSGDLVERVRTLDEQWKRITHQASQARKELNDSSKKFGELRKQGADTTELSEHIKQIKAQLEELAKQEKEIAAERLAELHKVGNVLDPTVPDGGEDTEGPEGPVVVRCSEPAPVPQAGLSNHVTLLNRLGGMDTVRGARVAGNRGYFLTGPGFLLVRALINFGIDFLVERGYLPVQTPFFMKEEVMGRCAQLSDFDEMLYKVTDGKSTKYLIATAEQPLCAFHMGEVLDGETLPIRFAGYSSCFRKEAGRHGVDTSGIFRIHQFEKVEQLCIAHPDKSAEMFAEMIKSAEQFYIALGIPYRVINIRARDMNNAAAIKYDLEGWFPGSGCFRELVSCSNCTDYQSRDLDIKFTDPEDKGRRPRHVHMLNSTLCAAERCCCAVVENYQTPEGVIVPEVLRPYMGGKEFIPFVAEPTPAAK